MKNRTKQLGQGMTEYIIIVALIAIAAVAVYGFFGQAIRGQMTSLTQELAGDDGTAAIGTASGAGAAAAADSAINKTLNTYQQ